MAGEPCEYLAECLFLSGVSSIEEARQHNAELLQTRDSDRRAREEAEAV